MLPVKRTPSFSMREPAMPLAVRGVASVLLEVFGDAAGLVFVVGNVAAFAIWATNVVTKQGTVR
jgi:hypothetical protein